MFDNEGAVLMTASGLCVHTSSGPAPLSNAQCDPDFVAPTARAVAPAPQAAVEPRAVVAQAPAPVVIAAVRPAPVLVKVTIDADTLFDFDKSDLRPPGHAALDSFAGQLPASSRK